MDDPELDKGLGKRAQIGGGLAAFIGVLLLVFTSPASVRTPVDLDKMAMAFIAIGVFLVAVGTLSRWYYLD